MTDTFLKVAHRGTPVFAVTELLDEKFLLEPPEFASHTDPHVWMDVSGWMAAVKQDRQRQTRNTEGSKI